MAKLEKNWMKQMLEKIKLFEKNTYFLWKIYQSNSLTEISLSHFQDSEFTAYTINLPSQKCSQGLQLL